MALAALALWLAWQWMRARQAGRDSEQRYRAVTGQTTDGVLLVEAGAERVLQANRAVLQLLGYPGKEVLSLSLADLVAAPDEHAARAHGPILGTDRPHSGEWHLRRQDGSVVAASFKADLARIDGRAVWCILVRDAGERQQLLDELRVCQARFRVLFAQSAVGIALVDLDGRVIEANPKLQELLGLGMPELTGMQLTEISHPDNLPGDRELFRDLAGGKRESYEVEKHFIHHDGHTVWARLLVSLVRDDRAKPAFAICMVEDVDARRRTERAVTRHAREMGALYETSLAINAQHSLSTLLHMIVRKAAELLDAHMGGLYVLQPDRETLRLVVSYNLPGTPLGSTLRVGEGLSGRVAQSGQALMLDDHRLWETRGEQYATRPLQRVLAVPLKLGERVIGVLTITDDRQAGRFSVEDVQLLSMLADQAAIAVENARLYESAQREIAERTRAEATLRRFAEELQARNDELDAFGHTVAHDLLNPLGTLVGFTTVLQTQRDTLDQSEVDECIDSMGQLGQKMTNIVEALLLLAGLRQRDVTPAPLDMAPIVAEVCERLAEMIAEHRGEIVTSDSWPIALGYGPWVEEVWVNYVSNGLKYGGQPPRLELGATRGGDGMVRFWVRDNGRGLTPEEQAGLFVPFTRLSQVRATGHGLGLSIVRRIAEKLGGQAGVESQVGRGSVFWFTLPAAPQS